VTRLRRSLRHLRRLFAYGLAGLVITAGLCVAVISQLLPLLGAHPERVAEWLSHHAGRPIEVTGVRAAWTRNGPRFELEGLRIGDGGEWLEIGRAALQLNVYAGLLPGHPLTSLQLTAPLLELERDAQGNWRLHGLFGSRSEGTTPELGQLDGLGELTVQGARLRVLDVQQQVDFTLPRIDARLRSSGSRVELGVIAHLDGDYPLMLNARLDRDSGAGHGYIGSAGLSLVQWQELLPDGRGDHIRSGRLSGGVWFEFGPQGPVATEFELQLEQLTVAAHVAGATLHASADGDVPPRPALAGDAAQAAVAMPPIELAGHWRREGDGWQLQMDTAAARAGSAAGYARVHARGEALTIEASDWALAPAGVLLASVGGLDEPLRAWLLAAAPGGRLAGLRVELDHGRLQRIEGLLQDLALAPVGTTPGFSGLSLAFDGDEHAIAVDLAGEPLVLDWPPALLEPASQQAWGRLQLYRESALDVAEGATPGWVVDVTQLRLRAEDYGVDLAGSLHFDGGGPTAALRASVEPGPIRAAHRFWIRHLMPETTVHWLETAIEDGWIEQGQVLIQGDFDDWPFKHDEGRFDAEAIISDARLSFHPDWPAAEQLAGSARFINNGMLIETSGRLLEIDASRARGRIRSFSDAVLELDVRASGSGTAMLDLLRNSPVRQSHGAHFETLRLGGSGDIALALTLPLDDDLGEPQLQGTVQLREAELADPRWGIAFDSAAGEVRFTDGGVLAPALEVRYAGQPARFSLAVGDFASDPEHAAEASLGGRLDPRTLLAAQPALEWLHPYLLGASEWLLELVVPAAEQANSTLTISSDLVGTRIGLPAPLAKADAVQMPLALRLELPAALPGDAAPARRLELRLGELLRLSGALGDSGRFDGVAAFGTADTVDPPARGIRVIGQAAVLDIAGWAGLALATADGEGLLADLDLSTGELDLAGRSFSDTRLRFSRNAAGGARLDVGGTGLQGVVEFPADEARSTRGITARFEQVHWPSSVAGELALFAADPVGLPPLHVWIGDLRVGDARLGEARLESFPVDHGMRIERFETRSPALELFARGDWTRSGLRQRSTFSLEFTAPDLGVMLRALGFETSIEGGPTLARLQATWPGAPTAFALEEVDGWLEASVGKGRIPDVEPGGAGRVFGLLSLSEIPRRLALDFSDFFRSGLAFSRIEGRFKLDDGNAFTDDLRIEGPAAEIRISGRTGLKAQDYEQTMEVLPRASNVLPVVGALAGGPAGAAIGAVAQAVLARPFKQMSRTLYSVGGSWSDPAIEVLERGPARLPGGQEPTAQPM
jgi:uncharacterized protein (TIGR02099 family)